MLKEKVSPGNLSISLTETIARFGYENHLLVLVEGFYETDIYGTMLADLRDLFAPKVLAYYYDLPFEETARRHATRAKKDEFTVDDMRRWWKEKDLLGWSTEELIRQGESLEASFERIRTAIDQFRNA